MATLKTKLELLEFLENNPQDSMRWCCGGGSVTGAGSWTVGAGAAQYDVDGRAANAVVKAKIVRPVGPADSRFAEYKVRPPLLRAELEGLRRTNLSSLSLSSNHKSVFSL